MWFLPKDGLIGCECSCLGSLAFSPITTANTTLHDDILWEMVQTKWFGEGTIKARLATSYFTNRCQRLIRASCFGQPNRMAKACRGQLLHCHVTCKFWYFVSNGILYSKKYTYLSSYMCWKLKNVQRLCLSKRRQGWTRFTLCFEISVRFIKQLHLS